MSAVEDRPSDSPYVERVWRAGGGPVSPRMLSVANSNWELVAWTHRGRTHAAIRGPETSPTVVDLVPDTAAFGIVFAHGAVLPHLPVHRLVDTAVTAARVDARSVSLGGADWELPGFVTAEDFVARLVRAGVLRRDPLVAGVLAGDEPPRLTARTAQRRILAATGLTRGTIRRIDRARHAGLLLGAGVTPAAVAYRLGYYDQPHLTRSLTRYLGRTAGRLRRPDPDLPLSLLYKTGG